MLHNGGSDIWWDSPTFSFPPSLHLPARWHTQADGRRSNIRARSDVSWSIARIYFHHREGFRVWACGTASATLKSSPRVRKHIPTSARCSQTRTVSLLVVMSCSLIKVSLAGINEGINRSEAVKRFTTVEIESFLLLYLQAAEISIRLQHSSFSPPPPP